LDEGVSAGQRGVGVAKAYQRLRGTKEQWSRKYHYIREQHTASLSSHEVF